MGRHHGLPRHDRLCGLHKDEVENEIHFMLQCTVYETVYETSMQKYLPRKYYIFPNVNKFNILMSNHSETVIHNVATYLYYAFKLRQELLDSISLDVMISYMLDGIPYLCTCNFTVCLSLFHVLWAGGLNHNKPFVLVLVLDNWRSCA